MTALSPEQLATVFDSFGDEAKHAGFGKRARIENEIKPLPVIDYADLGKISEKRWVVQDLLAAGETSCWFGPPGAAKSVIAEDLGLHVASQNGWQCRRIDSGAVLYVALERASVVARRGIAFGREHGVSKIELPFALLPGPLDFREKQTALKIIATIRNVAERFGDDPRLIIIDTVNRALNGGDENSPRDMGALIATLAVIHAALPGVHILLIHHTPVDGKGRMRGHSSLFGALDVALSVVKNNGVRLIEVVKASDFEEEQQIAFTLKGVVIGQDEQGGDISAPVVVAEQVSPPRGDDRKAAKIPKSARIAFTALCEALDEVGAIPPASNHIPPNVKSVTVDQWREYAYRRGVSGSAEARARQTAFKRAFADLVAARLVAVWEPHVWLV